MSTVKDFRTLPPVQAAPAGAEVAVADLENERTVRMPLDELGGSGVDRQAREAAADAQTTAGENRAEITAEETARRAADKALGERIDGLAHAGESVGRIDVLPGRIADAADLDGDYQCIVSLTDEEVTHLTERGANFLEIWFGAEAVHEVSPWAPALATRVDVTVDTTEESQIGAVGNVVPVRAVYRRNAEGAQLYLAEAPGALRVGGHVPAGVDAEARATAAENRLELVAEASTRRDMDTALGKRITGTARQALGRLEVNPGQIPASDQLDGTYQCIVKLTEQEVAVLAGAGVNYLEIWVGVEAIHFVSPWVPALVTRVDAVIDEREETQIGAVGNVVPVRAVYRINQGGGQAYFAEAAGALRVGGYTIQDAIDAGDTIQAFDAGTAVQLVQRLQAHADRTASREAALFHITADFVSATRSYKDGQRWYAAPHHGAEITLVLVSEAGEGEPLTLAQQIGLVHFSLYPNVLGNRGAPDFQRTFRLSVSGGDKITDDAWYDVLTQGQEVLARRKWDPAAIPNLVIGQAIATAISNNLDAGDSAAEFQVRFYSDADGMDQVEIVDLYVGVPAVLPAPRKLYSGPVANTGNFVDLGFRPGDSTWWMVMVDVTSRRDEAFKWIVNPAVALAGTGIVATTPIPTVATANDDQNSREFSYADKVGVVGVGANGNVFFKVRGSDVVDLLIIMEV